MILPTFNTTSKPASGEVVEVLMEKWDGSPWIIQYASWQEHRGEWIHEWTKRPIHEEIVGWRNKGVCACAVARKA